MATLEQKQKWTRKLNDAIREAAANIGWLFDDRVWRFEKTLEDGTELWIEGCVKSRGAVVPYCDDAQADGIIEDLLTSIVTQLYTIERKYRTKQ